MYKTYNQLKRLTRHELWDICNNEGLLTETDKSLTEYYFSKDTLLEMLSVNHREWLKKPFVNGKKELITK